MRNLKRELIRAREVFFSNKRIDSAEINLLDFLCQTSPPNSLAGIEAHPICPAHYRSV